MCNRKTWTHDWKRCVDRTRTAPDGVRAPRLSSAGSRAVRVQWVPAARNNADQMPSYQLQFMLDTGRHE